MGVSHLGKHARIAQSLQVNNGANDAVQFPVGPRPVGGKATTVGMPNDSGVSAYSRTAVNAAGKSAMSPGFGGKRMGQKTRQANVGRQQAGVLKTVHPQPNGGRAK